MRRRNLEKDVLKILSKGNWQEIELVTLLKEPIKHVLKKLMNMGLITKSERYGIYSITEKGRMFLKQRG